MKKAIALLVLGAGTALIVSLPSIRAFDRRSKKINAKRDRFNAQ